MSDSLEQLQQQRTQIIHQISELGDLRPGSITSTSGRCGKPSCRCHRPGQPGHGPHSWGVCASSSSGRMVWPTIDREIVPLPDTWWWHCQVNGLQADTAPRKEEPDESSCG